MREIEKKRAQKAKSKKKENITKEKKATKREK